MVFACCCLIVATNASVNVSARRLKQSNQDKKKKKNSLWTLTSALISVFYDKLDKLSVQILTIDECNWHKNDEDIRSLPSFVEINRDKSDTKQLIAFEKS